MKKILPVFLIVLSLILQISSANAADLFDLRVFPDFSGKKVFFDGIIVTSSHKENTTSRKNHISGLLGKWMASGSVVIQTDSATVTSTVSEGEFSGEALVGSLASFTIQVKHQNKLLHQETFHFPEKIDYLVISDIDDTILVTEVTNKLKMAYNSLLKSAGKRMAVANTPEFYQQLAIGHLSAGKPHFIYLSSSPAFLSRYLKAFLMRNSFPQGTVILKKSLGSGAHESHKSGWLKKIVARYPDAPLLLIGDSGEQDPFIYQSFVETNESPGKVKGIIIHEVTGRPTRVRALEQIRNHLQQKFQVPFIFWNCIKSLKSSLGEHNLLSTAD
jgi:phosphatidate phosphatase APP1